MNPNKGKVLLALSLVVSGLMGVGLALKQSPQHMALFEAPPTKIEPIAKPIQKTPAQSRSQDITSQLEQSNAAQLLKQLSKEADTKVQDSKSTIGDFIQQKTIEQRDHLKQSVVGALREAITGEVTQRANVLSDEFKGIKLSADQAAQLEKAHRQMQTEIVQQLKNDPQLVNQLKADLQAGRLNQTLSQSLSNYKDAVAQVLTPEQQQKWQKNFDLSKILK
ncbi:hypothetical protein [Leptolyngbya sp. FACHB-17]|uniref:hypothetical protein n=1 Tax=unclassified Leptolyngbya TaxID=2650499 RepID=UPI001680242F|nr:hypothetical protein [Leptolyngbya sp. FACHB-17]MBD2078874.1 hypothetical protein [Leptolyngbya sp. FACHB-17]